MMWMLIPVGLRMYRTLAANLVGPTLLTERGGSTEGLNRKSRCDSLMLLGHGDEAP